ncbi:hypothetical protein G647_02822 [Cladophialophora carrionii CBS 160.54]|uniref:Uncharacterized protein n=1 Tax=Cladophialophora carrionii CBS 160.54 TaxID=1279043 RepID=V9DGR5_9EURO|nr:uncharacterized protein G647_02822 [Cladophialophora carrionii CBS 160.54]ETI26045.1 hypothetical protein G647_02822 [Cladophialophora carrionii CBS 160.54]
MAWYSILPSHLTTYETWIIRAFLILAILNMVPWILAILYDFLYYVCRQIWHEVPFIGGRAQGAQRPRAPSLRDRARRMSFKDILTGGPGAGEGSETRRNQGHRRDLSRESISEEKEEEHGHDER